MGALLGATSAVFYAASVLIQKRLITRFSAWELGAFTKPFSVMVMAVALPSAGALAIGAAPWAILVAGALVCGAVPCVLFFWGLPHTSASRASILTLCEPTVAVLVGALVWQEPLGAASLAGAFCILGAGAIIAKTEEPARPQEILARSRGA
jgi:drug/metabolite transporter (DMT)-like permease